MEPEGRTPARIALSAAPRLVADGLQRVLAAAGVPVVTVPTGDASERFDLAIVTREAPSVAANVTITLDDGEDGRGGGTVTYAGTERTLRVDGFDAVIDFVRSWGDAAPRREP